jgi:hypothetical protein
MHMLLLLLLLQSTAFVRALDTFRQSHTFSIVHMIAIRPWSAQATAPHKDELVLQSTLLPEHACRPAVVSSSRILTDRLYVLFRRKLAVSSAAGRQAKFK